MFPTEHTFDNLLLTSHSTWQTPFTIKNLTCLELVYEYIILWNHELIANFAPLCNSTTRQSLC